MPVPERSPSIHMQRKQQEADAVYTLICDFFRKHHRTPTQKEISKLMGVSLYKVVMRVQLLRGQGRLAERSTVPTAYLEGVQE